MTEPEYEIRADGTEVRRTPGRVVAIRPFEGQTRESLEADFDLADKSMRELLAKGVQEWRSQYRSVGRLRYMAYKEVGPPPWRFPRVWAQAKRAPLTVSFQAGWRSTAYNLVVMWRRNHG